MTISWLLSCIVTRYLTLKLALSSPISCRKLFYKSNNTQKEALKGYKGLLDLSNTKLWIVWRSWLFLFNLLFNYLHSPCTHFIVKLIWILLFLSEILVVSLLLTHFFSFLYLVYFFSSDLDGRETTKKRTTLARLLRGLKTVNRRERSSNQSGTSTQLRVSIRLYPI